MDQFHYLFAISFSSIHDEYRGIFPAGEFDEGRL